MMDRKWLVLVALLALGCPTEGEPLGDDAGTWNPVRPPPGAPEGTVCWVFTSMRYTDRAWGGAVCQFPTAEVAP